MFQSVEMISLLKKHFYFMTVIILGLSLAACTNQDRRVAGYGASGAAIGALVGSASKNNHRSVVKGAAIGAVAGTLIGVAATRNGQQYCNYRDIYGRNYQAACN